MFLIIMASINPSWKLSQLMSSKMWNEMAYGSYKEYHDKVNGIYDYIANDSNENIFVFEKLRAVEGFSKVNLSEDMSDWVNTAIAQYYGKKSVQYVSAPLAVQSDGQKNIRISQDTFGGRTGYASIFIINGITQQTDALQILQPLESNLIISLKNEDVGKVAVYLFSDNEGKNQIDMIEIDY